MSSHSLAFILVNWLLSGLALWITSWIVPGFKLKSFGSSMIAAVVIGIVSFFLRPILLFLTFPINFLTLGLFTIVVNAILLKLSAAILREFKITSWISAIVGAAILAIVSGILNAIFF